MTPIGPGQLAEWFGAYGAAAVLFARQWLEPGAAEDVVQDVFVRLMAERRPPGNVKGWLFRSVRNAALNRLRQDRRRKRREDVQSAGRPAWFLPNAGNPMDAAAVERALEALPLEEREIVVLRVWAGMTLEEVAATVGRPVSTVHSRYSSALAAMRRELRMP